MAQVKKANIKRPILPEEIVNIAELGGEVVVRSLTLSQRLQLAFAKVDDTARLPRLLALVVLDADRQPIFSIEEWEAFGGQNPEPCYTLWDIARKLSGLDEETDAEKKSNSPK